METLELLESTVPVPGGNIYIRTWSVPDSKHSPIVLLHDSLGSVDQWRDFPKALAIQTNRTVIAYDRLGFGRSSPRSELPSLQFINEEAQQSFPALIQALALNQFVVLGHSVGGAMAACIAAIHPAQCQAVITESAQAFVEPLTVSGIAEAKAVFTDPAQFAKLERWHQDKANWVLRAWTDIWLSPEFSSWSLDDQLSQITCPVLAIHGEKDEYGTSAFPRQIVSQVKGPSQMAMLPCGHVPHRDMPEVVINTIASFLETIN